MDHLLEEAQRLLDEQAVYRVDDEVAVVLALQNQSDDGADDRVLVIHRLRRSFGNRSRA